MRIAPLLAASLLVAGCSHTVAGRPQQTQPGRATPTTAAPGNASAAPTAGAPISDVIAWIEAGHPADPGRFHGATRDGSTVPLGNESAFTVAAGKVSCMTDSKRAGGAVVCLVSLTNPPPAPRTSYGEWQGGWVDFDGVNLQVGSSRADPGPFVNGNGPELNSGDSLAFGDYRCRADEAGLFCVNYAHQSAARLSPVGVEPYGCLKPAPAPDGVGAAFSCS